jgi:SAM-dependent methyltransferase
MNLSTLHSPAADRNKAPILEQLQRVLPASGVALEVASGSGQHVAHFAAALAGWHWLPTDSDAQSPASIDAWFAGFTNVRPALRLDVLDEASVAALGVVLSEPVDALYCANMLHISPWATCAALMQLAARHLAPQGLLVLYGPYLEADVPTSPGNLAFDTDLRERDPSWGIRQLAEVLAQAAAVGLHLRERVAMPANNLLLVLARDGSASQSLTR